MAHTPETRQAVRSSYVHDRQPMDLACATHRVSYGTGRAWKRKAKQEGDCWDAARSASRMAAGDLGDITTQVIEDFVLLFQATIGELKELDGNPLQKAETIAKLSDAYVKTMKAAGGGNSKIAELAVAMKVLEELALFIKESYPDQLEIFAAILPPFGQRVSKVFV